VLRRIRGPLRRLRQDQGLARLLQIARDARESQGSRLAHQPLHCGILSYCKRAHPTRRLLRSVLALRLPVFVAPVDGQENPRAPCPSDLNSVGLGKRTGKTGLKSASGAATWASTSNPFALGLPPASPFSFPRQQVPTLPVPPAPSSRGHRRTWLQQPRNRAPRTSIQAKLP
jgi:hypothetical protein